VTGKNRNPKSGQRTVWNTPLNQLVKNHSTTIRMRGDRSATRARRQGMASVLSSSVYEKDSSLS